MKLSKKEKNILYTLLSDVEFTIVNRKADAADEAYPDKDGFMDAHNLLKTLYTIKGKLIKDEVGHTGRMGEFIESLNKEKQEFMKMIKTKDRQ